MILGISSFTYGWGIGTVHGTHVSSMDEIYLLERTLSFGLNCLQIGDNLPLHLFSGNRLENLKALSDKNNVRLEIGARKLNAQNLDRYIEIASFLKSPLLRFVIDDDDYTPAIDKVIHIIGDAIPSLKEKNITLGIENHDRFKAKELATILNTLANDQVGICLDCVNSLGAGEGFDYVSSVLLPYTVNLHIKDFNIQRLPHKMGFTITGAPAGKGMINIPMLLKKLLSYKRCRSVVLEQWVPPESLINDTIQKEKKWAEEGIEYLKQLPYFKMQHSQVINNI